MNHYSCLTIIWYIYNNKKQSSFVFILHSFFLSLPPRMQQSYGFSKGFPLTVCGNFESLLFSALRRKRSRLGVVQFDRNAQPDSRNLVARRMMSPRPGDPANTVTPHSRHLLKRRVALHSPSNTLHSRHSSAGAQQGTSRATGGTRTWSFRRASGGTGE